MRSALMLLIYDKALSASRDDSPPTVLFLVLVAFFSMADPYGWYVFSRARS